jgi:hypothetical protein
MLCVVNNGKLIEYLPIYFPRTCAWVDYVAYLHKLGFKLTLGNDTCQ